MSDKTKSDDPCRAAFNEVYHTTGIYTWNGIRGEIWSQAWAACKAHQEAKVAGLVEELKKIDWDNYYECANNALKVIKKWESK